MGFWIALAVSVCAFAYWMTLMSLRVDKLWAERKREQEGVRLAILKLRDQLSKVGMLTHGGNNDGGS